MCGIVGVISKAPVNQLIYDALLLLQHRGQDAAGIVTHAGTQVLHAQGARHGARRLPHPQHARAARHGGPRARCATPRPATPTARKRRQPFYVNAPFGIVLVHNGNLTNAQPLKQELFDIDRRHINTDSDTEVLLNVLAHELERSRARPAAHARRACSRPCAPCTSA